jgi:GDPmannose 4,6-dehydratase
LKRAFVSGVAGQDGSYLTELLLKEGYLVHGLIRRSSVPNTSRIEHLLSNPNLHLHCGDLTDHGSLEEAVRKARPDEVYNLAAMSHVGQSFKIPASTLDITGVGYARLIEVVRAHAPEAKVYQACSSEMFGEVLETPQTEKTPFNPRSPYGVAKAATYHIGRAWRKGYGMRIYNGILFNHESPRRGEQFVSKKVVQAAARIKRGVQDKLYLGNLSAKRDWGSAKEYAYWIWKIVQHDIPDDFLIATGETHSVEEFVAEAFRCVDLDWQKYVVVDEAFMRPAEVDLLLGDASKAKRVLGFEPAMKFKGLVRWMMEAEMAECSSTKTTVAA